MSQTNYSNNQHLTLTVTLLFHDLIIADSLRINFVEEYFELS